MGGEVHCVARVLATVSREWKERTQRIYMWGRKWSLVEEEMGIAWGRIYCCGM